MVDKITLACNRSYSLSLKITYRKKMTNIIVASFGTVYSLALIKKYTLTLNQHRPSPIVRSIIHEHEEWDECESSHNHVDQIFRLGLKINNFEKNKIGDK